MPDLPVFTVDAFLEGDRLRRGVDLLVGTTHLAYDDLELPLADIFWTSRRPGLLLAFARDYSAAFSASDERLDDLDRVLDDRVDGPSLRRALLGPLDEEIVVCSAGAAVSGTAEGAPLRGLFVTVFTQHGLHLLSGERRLRVTWPVRVAREAPDRGRATRPALVLEKRDTSLKLLYLLPEEIREIKRVAQSSPPEVAEERDGAIEMFARREVAGPMPARLPEFGTSTETIREHAVKAAASVPSDLCARASLEADFVVDHYQELGETALGPLLFRKSAASRARSLAKAVEAMDAGALQDDARAASLNSLRRLTDTYHRELRRLVRGKRRAQKLQQRLVMSEALRESLKGRFLAPVHGLAPRLQRLEEEQMNLIVRLQRLEEGPPEGEESELDAAAEEWHGALVGADRGFDAAWQELLAEIDEVWSETLLPRLAEAGGAPRQRVPEWVKLVAIGLVTVLVVATAMLLVRGLR